MNTIHNTSSENLFITALHLSNCSSTLSPQFMLSLRTISKTFSNPKIFNPSCVNCWADNIRVNVPLHLRSLSIPNFREMLTFSQNYSLKAHIAMPYADSDAIKKFNDSVANFQSFIEQISFGNKLRLWSTTHEPIIQFFRSLIQNPLFSNLYSLKLTSLTGNKNNLTLPKELASHLKFFEVLELSLCTLNIPVECTNLEKLLIRHAGKEAKINLPELPSLTHLQFDSIGKITFAAPLTRLQHLILENTLINDTNLSSEKLGEFLSNTFPNCTTLQFGGPYGHILVNLSYFTTLKNFILHNVRSNGTIALPNTITTITTSVQGTFKIELNEVTFTTPFNSIFFMKFPHGHTNLKSTTTP